MLEREGLIGHDLGYQVTVSGRLKNLAREVNLIQLQSTTPDRQ